VLYEIELKSFDLEDKKEIIKNLEAFQKSDEQDLANIEEISVNALMA
jgi:hypothetical protein